jgi:mono/diheme cytochrome c family protein/glucose/arabinose dehydrogenase
MHVQRSNIKSLVFIAMLAGVMNSCNKDPSPPLSPAEALESFILADPGVKIELVASEPLVQDPVAIAFDGAGRLWVVEMLSFMQDIDGTGEDDRIGRISVLFDDDGNGQMDRSQVFLDSLMLPRALGLVEGGILVAENIPLWYAEDTDGDFRADRVSLVDSAYGGSGMPEHSANGLWRGMDNWIYNAKSKFRYRKINGEWVKEETEFRGQWGIAHDNVGRLYYNYNWSQLHADLVPPNSLQDNSHHIPGSGIDHGLTLDRTIFPIRSNTAVNRGYVPGTLDGEGRLLEFASACGPLVYRGDALPKDYQGDAFICEPTANLIKQNNIIENGFMLSAEAVYPEKEFLASTDERFRPVSLASGPDGALYVVDMYKGIIQHGPYMTDYLRQVTLNRKLDKPIHMGRIWRITSGGQSVRALENLEAMEPETLVTQLGSANGWTRDTAQRLLVEKGGNGAVRHLAELVKNGNPLAQLHALWTLEGLGVGEAGAYLPALASEDPVVAQAALRILVPLATSDKEILNTIAQFVAREFDESPPLLQMQMILASELLPKELSLRIIAGFLDLYGDNPVARDVAMSSLEDREMLLFSKLQSAASEVADQKMEIIMEMLSTAITNSGNQSEINTLLSALEPANESVAAWVKNAIRSGMMNARPEEGKNKIALTGMPRLFKGLDTGESPELALLESRFTWPGKPEDTTNVKKETFAIDAAQLANGRQKYLNLCASCHGTQGEGMNRFAPPLQQSEWVNGKDYKLAMILLHGMEGPVSVNGKEYNIPDILPSMPSFTTLQDSDIADIATYIRNAWGHSNSPVSRRMVGGIRFRTQGKIQPWKAAELDTLQFSLED